MPTYESLPVESEFSNGILFQKMAEDLRLAGKANRTVYGYLRAIRQLADFCQKCPDELNEQDHRPCPNLAMTRPLESVTTVPFTSPFPFFQPSQLVRASSIASSAVGNV